MIKDLSKRELILIFIIVQLFLLALGLVIAFLTMKVTEPAALINQLTLGIGISSIVLAITTILYSFFQAYNSGKQHEIINDSLGEITSKFEDLVTLKTDVGGMEKLISSQITEVLDILKNDDGLTEASEDAIKNKVTQLEGILGEIYKRNITSDINNIKKNRGSDYIVTINLKEEKSLDQLMKLLQNLIYKLNKMDKSVYFEMSHLKKRRGMLAFRLTVYGITGLKNEEILSLLRRFAEYPIEVEKLEVLF